MADSSTMAPQEPFGVGAVISDAFGIFTRKLVTVIMIGAVPALLGLVIKGVLFGFSLSLLDPEALMLAAGGSAVAVSSLIDIAAYGLMTSMLVMMAYDAKVSRARPVMEYFQPALRVILPVVVMTIVVSLVIGIGFVLLIVPGIWLYGVLAATIPSIVIERAGFGAMGRSAALTKDYRWPIVGLLIVMFAITFVLSLIVGVIVGIPTAIGLGAVGAFILVILLNGISYGLNSIAMALTYARLREIKEGIRVDELAAVFD